MKRNLEALGFALLAALALSIVPVTSAWAEAPAEFTQPQNNYPVAITGIQEGSDNGLQTTSGRVTICSNTNYAGTLDEGSSELTASAVFSGCTSNGVTTHVDMNSCDFLFTAGTYTAGQDDADGSAHVKCTTPGDSITLTVGPGICTVHLPEQSIDGGVIFTNIAADAGSTPKDYVRVHINIQNKITYVETDTPSVFFCPFTSHTTEGHDGDFVSTVRVKGYDDSQPHTNANLVDIDVRWTP